ncbi:archaetidylserine decarboxylase [Pantoea sp. Nvir]|uniref:archaetidylserine decarboxylase n=1 Tax=Pantoea sp. Nvir TaxID=2576760 RepID=UPI00135CB24C|nr:archaetidylserine decarboxylase [Pantoea sp. Nvir]MXP67088.1 phosphatidylserine decarboxylase [Pantoea sp. Nvir]CAJ0990757.1 Phosphatidylserine decarboxylase proenzyme [Pantoea sp. Nvir]
MFNNIKLCLHHILPKKWLTELAAWGASRHGGWLTKLAIDIFIWIYKVDMSEACISDTASYHTFNEFFVRPLKNDARLVNSDADLIVLPADGVISQLGRIKGNQIFQAKGHYYTLEALLAGQEKMVAQFSNGNFVTIYLAPRDYHRVHMPCNGILRQMIYVPGTLYSVNPLTVRNIQNLFARNERIICSFDTNIGPMVQILVGATIVGSIETIWTGTITPPHEDAIKCWNYPAVDNKSAIVLLKGQEMGRFKLGSTVINLFAPGRVQLTETLEAESKTILGRPLAVVLPQTSTVAIVND